MSKLVKRILTSYIPGNPGVPATPGVPGKKAYCSNELVETCGYIPNPAVTYKYRYETAVDPYGKQYTQVWLDYLLYGSVFASTPLSYSLPGGTMSLNGVPLYVYQCTTTNVTTCYPAVAAIPGTPGIAPTPSQTIINSQVGWNSSSRSVKPISPGEYYPFTPAVGISGAFVGLGPLGMDGQPPNAFTHGVMVDQDGVRVYESGVFVATLANSYTGAAEISLVRSRGNTISYILTDGTTTSYTSAAAPSLGNLYAYGMLYTGGDSLTKTICVGDLKDLEFNEAVTFAAEGNLLVAAPRVGITYLAAVTLAGAGTLTAGGVVTTADGVFVVPHPMAMMFSGVGALLGYSSGANGSVLLPALFSLGGDYAYSFGEGWLPQVESGAMGGFYVPPVPTTGYGNLPSITSWGLVLESNHGDGDADLPALISLGGDYQYGLAQAWMPAMVSYGQDGQRLEMQIISGMYSVGQIGTNRVGTLLIMSAGQLQSVHTMQVAVLMEMLSGMVASGVYTILGEFDLALNSQLRIESAQMLTGVTGASLNETSRVWVVNMDTGASVQYDNYGFNSYFKRDGIAYGVADDGIYKLEGADDNGAQIDALVDLGKTKFSSQLEKRLYAAYITSAGGKLILKIETDGMTPYYYEMRSSSEYVDTHRVDPGKGLKGTEWSFTLLNQDGEDFEIASLEFKPLDMSRRI